MSSVGFFVDLISIFKHSPLIPVVAARAERRPFLKLFVSATCAVQSASPHARDALEATGAVAADAADAGAAGAAVVVTDVGFRTAGSEDCWVGAVAKQPDNAIADTVADAAEAKIDLDMNTPSF